MIERVRMSRPKLRRTFTGAVSRVGQDLALIVKRGCWTRAIDKQGEIVGDERESQRMLLVNLGDRLLLSSVANDNAFAFVEIVGITANGWNEQYRARWHCGEVENGDVYVMSVAWAKASAREKRRAA